MSDSRTDSFVLAEYAALREEVKLDYQSNRDLRECGPVPIGSNLDVACYANTNVEPDSHGCRFPAFDS
jgi:hypothetical protein